MNLEGAIKELAQPAGEFNVLAAKKDAGAAAVRLVEDGMRLGLGTGSTVAFFLEELAQRIKTEGIRVFGVPTSESTRQQATRYGIPIAADSTCDLTNDLCIDGADRVDRQGHLIKGGGGALLREKMVAYASHQLCIMVDPSKLRSTLDDSFPVPIECIQFGITSTMAHLEQHHCQPHLRQQGSQPYITDNGHVIVDCTFSKLTDPANMEARLLAIPGVVEVGLFCGMLNTLIVGHGDGSSSTLPLR